MVEAKDAVMIELIIFLNLSRLLPIKVYHF